MRIARIRHLFYPDLPKDYFYELSTKQAERGHEIHIITWSRNGKYSVEKIMPGFFVHRLCGVNFGFGTLIEDYPFLPRLAFELRSISPDIVHAESHLFLPTLQALRYAKKKNLPCVVSVHGVSAERGSLINFLQQMYIRTLGVRIFNSVSKIICLTENDARSIIRFGSNPEKIKIVPNGVNTDLFKPFSVKVRRSVIWAGRFVPEKGLEYLIKAAKLVSSKNGNIEFLLVGYGPLKARLMNLANTYGLLGTVVKFLPSMKRSEIVKVLNESSIFVFPSLKEGMPLSLLEAMACGKCVIGTNIPGVNDIITDKVNGILVPPRDYEALAEAILDLSRNDSIKTELGLAARRTVIARFSIDKTINNLNETYSEVFVSSS